MSENWIRPVDRMPEKDQAVYWLNSVGTECSGWFVGRWMLESGLCVYYEPVFWKARPTLED